MTQQPKLFFLVALPTNRSEKREATREVERILSKLQPIIDGFEKDLFNDNILCRDYGTLYERYLDLFNKTLSTISPNKLRYVAINPYYFKEMFSCEKVDMKDLDSTKTSKLLALTREKIRNFTFRHCYKNIEKQ